MLTEIINSPDFVFGTFLFFLGIIIVWLFSRVTAPNKVSLVVNGVVVVLGIILSIVGFTRMGHIYIFQTF